jgi:hypothetical protein
MKTLGAKITKDEAIHDMQMVLHFLSSKLRESNFFFCHLFILIFEMQIIDGRNVIENLIELTTFKKDIDHVEELMEHMLLLILYMHLLIRGEYLNQFLTKSSRTKAKNCFFLSEKKLIFL